MKISIAAPCLAAALVAGSALAQDHNEDHGQHQSAHQSAHPGSYHSSPRELRSVGDVVVVDADRAAPAGDWTPGNAGHAAGNASRYGAADRQGLRVVVEVPTLERLRPFQRFVINPWERQDDPARFEIRERGTIRNAENITNPFVRGPRFVAERLEEARLAWLRENGYVGGVRSFRAADRDGDGPPTPRATIRLPEGASGGGGYRVQGGPGAPAAADRDALLAALTRMREHRARVVTAEAAPADDNASESESESEPTVAAADGRDG